MSTPRIETEAAETAVSVWLPKPHDPEGTVPMLKLYCPNQGELNLLGSTEDLFALHRRIGAALNDNIEGFENVTFRSLGLVTEDGT